MVMLVSRTLLVFFGTLCLYLSRALLVFLAVRFLRWNIKHAWFFLLFYSYVGISRTLVSRARLVFFGVPLEQ